MVVAEGCDAKNGTNTSPLESLGGAGIGTWVLYSMEGCGIPFRIEVACGKRSGSTDRGVEIATAARSFVDGRRILPWYILQYVVVLGW